MINIFPMCYLPEPGETWIYNGKSRSVKLVRTYDFRGHDSGAIVAFEDGNAANLNDISFGPAKPTDQRGEG